MPRVFHLTIRFRATKRDERKLARVATYFDRSPSEVLRQLVSEAYARLPPRARVTDTRTDKPDATDSNDTDKTQGE